MKLSIQKSKIFPYIAGIGNVIFKLTQTYMAVGLIHAIYNTERTSNAQRKTSNIKSPTLKVKPSMSYVQTPTSNIQRPTS